MIQSIILDIVWIALAIYTTITTGRITIRLRKVNKKIDQANKSVAESNKRLNLLSAENAKLIEENEVYKDKLKNMGFTDVHLKL